MSVQTILVQTMSRNNMCRCLRKQTLSGNVLQALLLCLGTALLILATESSARGQGVLNTATAQLGKTASHADYAVGQLQPIQDPGEPTSWQPFLPSPSDGGVFDVYSQFFAPAELEPFGRPAKPKTGFFFLYDRAYIQFSRPLSKLGPNPNQINGAGNMLNPIDPLISDPVNNAAGDGVVTPAFINTNDPGPLFGNFSRAFDGDYAWGNRWEFGYMTEADTGWSMSVWRIEGPTYGDPSRTGIFNMNQTTPMSPVTVTFPDGTTVDISGRLNAGSLTPTNLVLEYTGLQRKISSLFWSVELNKDFRVITKDSAIFEPFFGVRYVFLRDAMEDILHSLDFFSTFPYLSVNPRHDGFLTIYNQVTQNHMVGPQIGFRYQKQMGRVSLGGGVRAVAAYNRQFLGMTLDPGVLGLFTPYESRQEARDEFVPYGELRVQAGYEVTRGITLHGGFDLMYFGRGVARVNTAPQEFRPFPIGDQDLILAGFTGGIVINR